MQQLMSESRRRELCRYLASKIGQTQLVDGYPAKALLNSKGKSYRQDVNVTKLCNAIWTANDSDTAGYELPD